MLSVLSIGASYCRKNPMIRRLELSPPTWERELVGGREDEDELFTNDNDLIDHTEVLKFPEKSKTQNS